MAKSWLLLLVVGCSSAAPLPAPPLLHASMPFVPIDAPAAAPPDAPEPPYMLTEAALDQILGKGPAKLGTLFDGVGLDMPQRLVDTEANRRRFAAYEKTYKAEIELGYETIAGEARLASIMVSFPIQTNVMQERLESRWGEEQHRWRDEPSKTLAGIVASYTSAGVAWDHYRTVDELIAPKDKTKLGFEPFPLIGAPVERLQAWIGETDKRSPDDDFFWTQPGLGGEGDYLMLRIHVKAGIFTSFEGGINTIEHGAADAIMAALVAKYAKPKHDGTKLVFRQGKLEIRAESRGSDVLFEVGPHT